jgi:enoyl-[acyl-carrier protein] reductase I
LSTAVTGEIHYVDSGYNTVAMPRPETIKESGEGTTALHGNGNGNGNGDGEVVKPQAAE